MSDMKRSREYDSDSKHNGRQVRAKVDTSVTISLRPEQVSHLIGKGGAFVKELIRQSGAYVKFDRADDTKDRQNGRVYGALESMANMFGLIAHHIQSWTTPETRQAGHGDLVWLVPTNKVGSILGRKGTTLKDIERTTGVRIKIGDRPDRKDSDNNDNDDDNSSSSSGDVVCQTVRLRGDAQNIYFASRLLLFHLFPEAPHNTRDSAGRFGYNSRQAPSANDLEVRFGLRSCDVGRVIGKGGEGIKELTSQARVRRLVFDRHKQSGLAGPDSPPGQVAVVRGSADNIIKALGLVAEKILDPENSPDTVTDIMDPQDFSWYLMIPSHLVGFVMGKNKVNLNDYMDKSGTDMKLAQKIHSIANPDTGESLQGLHITGNLEGVMKGVELLVLRLEEHRGSLERRSQGDRWMK